VPFLLKKFKADLFLSTDGYLSLRTKVPQVVVMHDINFVHRPKDLPLLTSRYYNYFFPRFARKAQRIATVSEYSKNDLVSSFALPPGKIDVVYNGLRSGFSPLIESEVAKTREEYSSGHPYFLFVGALHPRKNIEGLLMAFDTFKHAHQGPVKLIISGGKMFKTGKIHDVWKQMQYRSEVIFTGRLSSDALSQVMGGALALTFVPFFEGFGIPVLEAMASGVPVICSKTTSLPEVGGDAVLYVNPGDVQEIASAMKKVAEEPNLRAAMIDRGLVQCKKFSWDQTAEKLWNCVQKVLNENSQLHH
jgi:glycosyltransferase involved in cell wall biosynthesis